jgi:hypothetical protein
MLRFSEALDMRTLRVLLLVLLVVVVLILRPGGLLHGASAAARLSPSEAETLGGSRAGK